MFWVVSGSYFGLNFSFLVEAEYNLSFLKKTMSLQGRVAMVTPLHRLQHLNLCGGFIIGNSLSSYFDVVSKSDNVVLLWSPLVNKKQKWFYEWFLCPQSLVPSFDITLPLRDTASVCFNKFGSILSCSIIVYCFSLINSVMSWFWDWILVKHCQNNKVSDLLTLQLGRKSFDVKNYSNI